MLSVRLDPDLEQLLEHDVDDLARYNILRYLRDKPAVRGNVNYFSEELGLRCLERTEEALEALVRAGLLIKHQADSSSEMEYGLSTDPGTKASVERLYRLSLSPLYGEIVEQLAAKSLHRARKAQLTAEAAHKSGHAAA